MNKALAIVEPQAVTNVTEKDLDDWLFGTGTKLTPQQKSLFYKVALSCNLNPIKKEVYAIPYGNNFNIIVGYEVYLKRAERSGLLEWWEATVEKIDNEWVGRCTIKRKDFSKPVTVDAWFNEYNQGTALWKSKPRTMIRKVAISQGFRMVFSEELGGLPYTSDEIMGEEIKTAEFTSLDVAAEKVAGDDLSDRKQKAINFLEKKGKTYIDAQVYLDKEFPLWTQEDLDSLKKWAKAGFPTSPEPQGEAQEGKPEQSSIPSQENPATPPRGISEGTIALIADAAEATGIDHSMPCERLGINVPLSELTEQDGQDILSWYAKQ